jgi:sulfur-carrier protein
MNVTVKLFASFQKGRFVMRQLDLAPEATVGDVVDSLAIPRPEIGVVMVDGRHADFSRPLAAGETLAIFPVIGGG